MIRPARDWRKVAADFASTYLLPVLGVFVVVVLGLGLLGIVGLLLRHVVIPAIAILVLLTVAALLTADVVWRLSTFNALLGLIFTYPAVSALTREPLQAILGMVIGAFGTIALHLYGDTLKAAEQSNKKVMTDTRGQTYQVVILSGNASDTLMLAAVSVGLVVILLCWFLRHHGAWDFFLGLYASTALGRAISWISVESDTQTLYFWQPFPFLKQVPGFSHFFRWWQQVKHVLGIGIAHWSQE